MTTAALDRLLERLTHDLMPFPVLSHESAQAVMLRALQDATAVRATPLPRCLAGALHEARTAIQGGLRYDYDSYGPKATHVVTAATERLAEAALAIGREQAADAVRLHHTAIAQCLPAPPLAGPTGS